MDVSELLDRTRENFGAQRVFGQPIQAGELLVVPAARVQGGAGGGGGSGPQNQGSGSGAGYGISARPAGAYVLQGGKLRWRPAVDVNRIILGGQLVAATAILALSGVLRAKAQERGRRGLFRRRRRRA